jgi:predicted DsbA family dithiol-disulfide isomerase
MRIDIFHDTVCPWCRIGKAHLKQALAEWDGEDVTIYYHTFFLNADIPEEGVNFREYMEARFNGRATLEQLFDGPTQAGQRAGLTFNFDKIERSPNTLLSHQLIALTPAEKQESVIDAIYAAYFEHGRDIGQLDELVKIAEEQGLDAESIRADLEAGKHRDTVLGDALQGSQIGVTGVPFFILNQRLAFSGAQPPAMILDAMRQAADQDGN